MYEGKAGAKRLIEAIERAISNQERLELLAGILYYDADQLKEDVKAIVAETEE